MTSISQLSTTLEQRRKAMNLSFLELTRQSGVSRQAIYRLFHGQDVQLTTLLAVCKVLQTDLLTVPHNMGAHVLTTNQGQATHAPSAQEARMQRLRTSSTRDSLT